MAFTEDWLQQHQAKMAAQRAAGGVRVLERPVDATSSAQPAVAGSNTGSQQGRGTLSPDTTNGGVVATGLSGSACGARVKALGVTPAVARATPQAGERPAPKSKKQRPEEVLQIAAAELLDLALPQGWRWWHTPNQRGTRKFWEQQLLKALGVKAGVQDITIVGPDPRLVIIELKAGDGKLSRSQKDWRDFYRSIGVPWFLARSIEDVISSCQDAGVPLRARV